MNFIYLILLSFTIISCSDSSFQDIGNQEDTIISNSEEDTSKETTADLLCSENILISSCIEGCKYNYRIYTVAKELKKDSISLNKAQLKSIQESCNFFCKKKLLKELNKQKPIKNEKKSNNIKVVPFEEEEKEKNKNDTKEITPFEEL